MKTRRKRWKMETMWIMWRIKFPEKSHHRKLFEMLRGKWGSGFLLDGTKVGERHSIPSFRGKRVKIKQRENITSVFFFFRAGKSAPLWKQMAVCWIVFFFFFLPSFHLSAIWYVCVRALFSPLSDRLFSLYRTRRRKESRKSEIRASAPTTAGAS